MLYLSHKRLLLILLILLILTAVGMSGCARQAQRTFPEAVVTLPPPTPAPVRLPRFTPHVTSIVPTPAPIARTPMPAASPLSPAPPASPLPPSPTPRIHVVQPHETLLDIAVHYQVSLEALARANGVTDPTTIKPGDLLVIP